MLVVTDTRKPNCAALTAAVNNLVFEIRERLSYSQSYLTRLVDAVPSIEGMDDGAAHSLINRINQATHDARNGGQAVETALRYAMGEIDYYS